MAQPIFKSRAMLRVEERLERPLEEWLAERYQAAGQEAIAEELGVSGATVSRWMRELGVETRFPGQRPPTEARRMTAKVIDLPSGRGRPSNARLASFREYNEELHSELSALIGEGSELGSRIVAIARRAQVLLAAGHSPANLLDELERLGLRHTAQMTAAGVDRRAEEACPDGIESIGHGAAA